MLALLLAVPTAKGTACAHFPLKSRAFCREAGLPRGTSLKEGEARVANE
jgi:hypothetical protein